MLDETESSTALKPKISLEMLLRDIELYWEKKIFQALTGCFLFPHKKMALIFRGSETPEFLVQTVTTTATLPHSGGTALSLYYSIKKAIFSGCLSVLPFDTYRHTCMHMPVYPKDFTEVTFQP